MGVTTGVIIVAVCPLACSVHDSFILQKESSKKGCYVHAVSHPCVMMSTDSWTQNRVHNKTLQNEQTQTQSHKLTQFIEMHVILQTC